MAEATTVDPETFALYQLTMRVYNMIEAAPDFKGVSDGVLGSALFAAGAQMMSLELGDAGVKNAAEMLATSIQNGSIQLLGKRGLIH